MKSIIISALLLFSTNAFSASQFTWSGEQIQTIFNSPMVWQKIGGSVESIVFKGYEDRTSTFAITTTESKKIMNEEGAVVEFQPSPCLTLVEVTASGDLLAPSLEVTNVDFSACPTATN